MGQINTFESPRENCLDVFRITIKLTPDIPLLGKKTNLAFLLNVSRKSAGVRLNNHNTHRTNNPHHLADTRFGELGFLSTKKRG